MRCSGSPRALFAFAAALATGATASGVSAAPAAAQHVRGVISSATASSLIVTAGGSSVTLALTPATKVVGVVPATLADIAPGTFIGTANVPSGGTSRALEVVVFPPSMKGTGLGDYPWDLSPGGGGSSTMTNGTVGAGHGSTMTNGTVGGAAHGSAMTNGTVHAVGAVHAVTVDYGKGSKTIAIPPNAPIVRIVPATRGDLVAGAHVFVIPGNGSPTTASRIVVGLKGTVPPM